ncbi:hypothetical protein BDR05DRAFT_950294 [Suillus weaverae]|nr:hypothetical protein BDR05DRAFT_950294 [Suillus weaverae]
MVKEFLGLTLIILQIQPPLLSAWTGTFVFRKGTSILCPNPMCAIIGQGHHYLNLMLTKGIRKIGVEVQVEMCLQNRGQSDKGPLGITLASSCWHKHQRTPLAWVTATLTCPTIRILVEFKDSDRTGNRRCFKARLTSITYLQIVGKYERVVKLWSRHLIDFLEGEFKWGIIMWWIFILSK